MVATPAPQQGCLLTGPIEGCQMVKVTGPGQAVGPLQFQVQEEHLDPVARGLANDPVAPDIVGVGVGVLWAGEIAPHSCVHLLASSWIGERGAERAMVKRMETVTLCSCGLGSRFDGADCRHHSQPTGQLIPKPTLN